MRKKQLVSVFDFENREGLFTDIDRRMKFCLLTLTGTANPCRIGLTPQVFFRLPIPPTSPNRIAISLCLNATLPRLIQTPRLAPYLGRSEQQHLHWAFIQDSQF